MADRRNASPRRGLVPPTPGGAPGVTPLEREALRRFLETTDERPSWSADRLVDVAREIEGGTAVTGDAWTLLKESLPYHTQWPQARLIALVERIEMGLRPGDAGFSELLHAQD